MFFLGRRKMNSEDFEDLILYSQISADQDSGLVSFVAYKGKENTIADLVKKKSSWKYIDTSIYWACKSVYAINSS